MPCGGGPAKVRACHFRYQYDPNPRVSEAMSHIWHALVPEPKKAVDASFDQICTELLREMGGRLWRNREACCAGMADLLQVRTWHTLLPQVWTRA